MEFTFTEEELCKLLERAILDGINLASDDTVCTVEENIDEIINELKINK